MQSTLRFDTKTNQNQEMEEYLESQQSKVEGFSDCLGNQSNHKPK